MPKAFASNNRFSLAWLALVAEWAQEAVQDPALTRYYRQSRPVPEAEPSRRKWWPASGQESENGTNGDEFYESLSSPSLANYLRRTLNLKQQDSLSGSSAFVGDSGSQLQGMQDFRCTADPFLRQIPVFCA